MKITKIILLLFSAFFSFFTWADCADCQAYKTQVVNDCDSIILSIQQINADANAINGTVSYIDSPSVRDYVATLSAQIIGTCNSLDGLVRSIKSTAQSIQCNVNSNGCDCATFLQSISVQLTTINNSVVANGALLQSLSTRLQSVDGTLSSIEDWLDDFRESYDDLADDFYSNGLDICDILAKFFLYDYSEAEVPFTISDFYYTLSSITNRYNVRPNAMAKPLYQYLNASGKLSKSSFSNGSVSSGEYKVGVWPYLALNSTDFKNVTLFDTIYGGFWTTTFALSSLNNYAYTNLVISSLVYDSVFDSSKSLSALTNQFSIFIDASVGASPILSAYTAQDGSYHDYLTNYYIQVSSSSVSGSTPLTNWFNRVEMLLAALVFNDEGTNFVDDSVSTTQFENTLSQSVDSLSQAVSLPQNVTGKIDNMGQSFLGLLGEWRTIVSGNSLPSHFVLCDINLSSSQNRDSSSIDSFRLETSLDSGEFRQFLDFCHAITTILFTMLFVWLSIFLLSFLLSSLARLAYFCYTVYSALFGG